MLAAAAVIAASTKVKTGCHLYHNQRQTELASTVYRVDHKRKASHSRNVSVVGRNVGLEARENLERHRCVLRNHLS